jgi:hypothetical protein
MDTTFDDELGPGMNAKFSVNVLDLRSNRVITTTSMGGDLLERIPSIHEEPRYLMLGWGKSFVAATVVRMVFVSRIHVDAPFRQAIRNEDRRGNED